MKIIKLMYVSCMAIAIGFAVLASALPLMYPPFETNDSMYGSVMGMKIIVARLEQQDARVALKTLQEFVFVYFFWASMFLYLYDRLKTAEKHVLEIEGKIIALEKLNTND